jgi:CRP-like cAMP-binding protein
MRPQFPGIRRNQLLNALPANDLESLEPHLEFKEFPGRHAFEEANRPIKYAYFFERGFASMMANSPGGRQVEVGLIGREGVSGMPIIMGDDRSPHSTNAQVDGAGYRISARMLRETMDASPTLHRVLLNFAHVLTIQIAQTALANARARLDERLARWILMGHDRVSGDDLPLTHEFLSIMLGARRPSVTVTMRSLERRGLIRTRRGHVLLVDQAGLEKIAGSSYGVPEAEYRRLIRGRSAPRAAQRDHGTVARFRYPS